MTDQKGAQARAGSYGRISSRKEPHVLEAHARISVPAPGPAPALGNRARAVESEEHPPRMA